MVSLPRIKSNTTRRTCSEYDVGKTSNSHNDWQHRQHSSCASQPSTEEGYIPHRKYEHKLRYANKHHVKKKCVFAHVVAVVPLYAYYRNKGFATRHEFSCLYLCCVLVHACFPVLHVPTSRSQQRVFSLCVVRVAQLCNDSCSRRLQPIAECIMQYHTCNTQPGCHTRRGGEKSYKPPTE